MKYFAHRINIRATRTGFSLLELLIYMAILSVLMVIITNSFIAISRGRGQSEAKSEVNSAMRFAIERIRQDLKNATSTSPVVTPLLGAASSTLMFITASSSVVTYTISAGQLLRTYDMNTLPVTGANITVGTSTFTRIENYNTLLSATTTSVMIDMTFNYNTMSTDWSYADTLHTAVTLR